MNVVALDSYEAACRKVADIFSDHLAEKPDTVLGLATGTTPLGLYSELVKDFQEGKISFAQATTFNLDEYCGLEPRHHQSYRYFMETNLFNKVDICLESTHVPDGMNTNTQDACDSYEQAIQKAGGIDIQLLGLGINGHIGFNEPAASFAVATHKIDLAQSTIQANSRLFNGIHEVPTQAYTMGIGTIMAARKIVVIVSGASKAKIVREAFFGPVVPQVPASILQLHPHVTVIVDSEAGALIP